MRLSIFDRHRLPPCRSTYQTTNPQGLVQRHRLGKVWADRTSATTTSTAANTGERDPIDMVVTGTKQPSARTSNGDGDQTHRPRRTAPAKLAAVTSVIIPTRWLVALCSTWRRLISRN